MPDPKPRTRKRDATPTPARAPNLAVVDTPPAPAVRHDSFVNALSGLGGAGDKGVAATVDMERVPLSRVKSNGAFFSPELLITLRANGIVMREVGIPHHKRMHHEPKGTTPKAILKAIRDLLLLRLAMWIDPDR